MINKDIYNTPTKSVKVLCHTTLGHWDYPKGRFYLKGNEYTLGTEIVVPLALCLAVNPKEDTNWEDCILCWINQTEGFGCRFVVKGNIYHNGEPIWPHFTDYFVCPVKRDRDNKLTEIGIIDESDMYRK